MPVVPQREPRVGVGLRERVVVEQKAARGHRVRRLRQLAGVERVGLADRVGHLQIDALSRRVVAVVQAGNPVEFERRGVGGAELVGSDADVAQIFGYRAEMAVEFAKARDQ
jgi:hypothetical protein